MLRKNEILGILSKACLLLALILFLVYNHLRSRIYNVTPVIRQPNMKYILQWTSPTTYPFESMGIGQDNLYNYSCPVTRCYITSNRALLNSLTDFNAILFHGPELYRNDISLPNSRQSHQKYVFVSMESSANYPILDEKYDNFFNWTWTYKLNSDLFYGYFIIKNKNDNIIGPKEIMHWIKFEEMKPIHETLKTELSNKKRLAAWFVSNCRALSERETYVREMRYELAKYNNSNLRVDVFGRCSKYKCPLGDKKHCMLLLKKVYHFYLSFENSFSEDYVTEKLLTALQNNVVPVVFGGANYTRFMPDSAYLNARKFSPKELVEKMVHIASNTESYNDFFRWKNYYSYHDLKSPETNALCTFCSKINEEAPHIRKLSYYTTFRTWWNPLVQIKKYYRNDIT